MIRGVVAAEPGPMRSNKGVSTASPETRASFRSLWTALAPIGRDAATGGYRRFAWTEEDRVLRSWFADQCTARDLTLTEDRMGNQWAWWGDPDAAVDVGDPGIVIGSHLDSVPDGGAFDGPLGVVSALAAVDALRRDGFRPARPIGVVNFVDEEGARFGVACAGSRVITGALAPERARSLTDADGTTMAEAMRVAGRDPDGIGPDPEALRRVGAYVELHIEQGRALVDLEGGHPVAVGSDIWPHGRWRVDVPGEANHAGTTRLADRHDAMLGAAAVTIAARRAAEEHGCVATVGKVRVTPGGVNAVPSSTSAWLDARGADEAEVRAVVAEVSAVAGRVRRLRHRGVLDPADALRPGPRPPDRRAARRHTRSRHRRRARRGHPRQRGGARRHAVRPQPDRRLALAGGVGRRGRLPRGHRRPRLGRLPSGGSRGMTTYWCEHAQLPAGLGTGVRLTVEGGRIAAVEQRAKAQAGDELLTGIVLPGFANAHSHVFHRALRGRTHADGGTFWTWREHMYAVTERLTPQSYLDLARAVFAEMVLAGYTVVGEFHYLHHQAGGRAFADPNAMGRALIAAAGEAGIRLTLLDTLYLTGGLSGDGHLPLSEAQRRFDDGSVDAWAARVADLEDGPMVRIGAAAHSVRAVPRDDLARFAKVVDDRPVHIHVSEQMAENVAAEAFYGLTPTELLADTGLLGPGVTTVHSTHLVDTDLDSMARSGASACLCPTTERDLADGIGPARALHDRGVPLCVGSDQHVVIDPFVEVRAVEEHERLETNERGRFALRDLAAFGAGNGYRSLGWERGGVLEPGALADLVAVRLDSVRTVGARPDQVVFAAGAPDVTDVVVGGERVVSDGEHRLGRVDRMLGDAMRPLREPQ